MVSPSYKAILKKHDQCSEGVKWYFDQLPSLLRNGYSYEVSLAYLFLRTERAQNMALYCGSVKLHRANTDVTSRAVNAQHLTREGFLLLYRNVFDRELPKSIKANLEVAERIRDKVVHGKNVTEPEMRTAHIDVLEYAEAMNAEIREAAGFEPFGKLQGFKGRGQALDKKTTRWLLKGIGFAIA